MTVGADADLAHRQAVEAVRRGLAERGLTVRRYAKPTFTRPMPADLRAEIAAECDVVIEALAD